MLALIIWDTLRRRKAATAGETYDAKAAARTPLGILLSILVVLTAVGAGYRVYQVGHSGAKAVWESDAGAPGGMPAEGGEVEGDEEGAVGLVP